MAFNFIQKIKERLSVRKDEVADSISLKMVYESFNKNEGTMELSDLLAFEQRMKEAKEVASRTAQAAKEIQLYNQVVSIDPYYQGQGGARLFADANKQFNQNAEVLNNAKDVITKTADKTTEVIKAVHEQLGLNGSVQRFSDDYSDIKAVTNEVEEAKAALLAAEQKLAETNQHMVAKWGVNIENVKEAFIQAEEKWADNYEDAKGKVEQIAKEVEESITPAMQKLYNVTKDYESTHNGEKPSLRFLAEEMNKFNRTMESSGIAKMCEDLGISSTKYIDSNDYTYSDNATVIMETMGPDAFQNFIGLFHKDDELNAALKNISAENMMVFTELGIKVDNDGQAAFYTKALFDNGLPSGLELSFKPNPTNEIELDTLTFHGKKLESNDLLNSAELQNIVNQLPTKMRNQVEAELNLIKVGDTYQRNIIADGKSLGTESAIKEDLVNQKLQGNYDKLKESLQKNSSGFLMGMTNYSQVKDTVKENDSIIKQDDGLDRL